MNNEIFEDKLRYVAEDSVLLEALKFVFNERIQKEKPNVDGDDNAKLGERYRAYDQSIRLLKEVFVDIEAYKNKKVGSEKYNKGK